MEGGVRGLVVVFSAMMIQVLAFGNYAVIGIYTTYFLEIFHGDAVGVSLVSAVHFASLLGCGPLVSFLMTKVSYRKLCLMGASLVSIGIFCTPLIVSLPAMYVTFGAFAGLGGCLIYIPSHVLTGMYYDKHRSLAVGVATSGTALGGTVMPVVVGTLIEKYTWRGSLIVLAAIDAHLFIFAMLMVPPPQPVTAHKDPEVQPNGSLVTSLVEPENDRAVGGDSGLVEQWLGDEGGGHEGEHSSQQLCQFSKHTQTSRCNDRKDDTIKMRPKSDEASHSPHIGSGDSYRYASRLVKRSRPCSLDVLPADDITRILAPSYLLWSPFQEEKAEQSLSFIENPAGGAASEKSFPQLEAGEQAVNYHTDSGLIEFETEILEPGALTNWKRSLRKHLVLLRDPQFLIYCVSTLVWSLTTTLYLTFAPEVMVRKGFSRYTVAFVFTYFGVGQLIGCVFISVFGDFLGRRIILYVLANVFTGLFMALTPQMCSYTQLAAILVLEGVAYGAILGLYMSVTIDLVGVQDLDVGFGYVVFSSGVGCFSGPPIGGGMSEHFGSYDEAFYLSGLLTAVGGGLIMLLTYLPICRSRT